MYSSHLYCIVSLFAYYGKTNRLMLDLLQAVEIYNK